MPAPGHPSDWLLAVGSWIGLVVLTLAWEGWLAPSTYAPPGFWLTIKALPLLIPLFGLLHDRRRAYVIAGLLATVYLIEGVVITWGEWSVPSGNTALWFCSMAELALLALFYAAAVQRLRRRD